MKLYFSNTTPTLKEGRKMKQYTCYAYFKLSVLPTFKFVYIQIYIHSYSYISLDIITATKKLLTFAFITKISNF